MYYQKLINIFSLVLFVGLIGGCASQSDHRDLDAYIDEVKARPKGNIEPLPPVRTYEAFVYSATAMRSPFDPPIDVPEESVAATETIPPPDQTRIKDFLETFNLDSLSMVGTVRKDGILWALVRDPDSGIHRVKTGNYMGQNHGEIIKTTTTKIDLVETVPNGHGQWQHRPRSITLSEKE